MDFSLEELTFILDCIEYSERSYVEKSSKYLRKDDFYATKYRPKLDQFQEIKSSLKKLITEKE